MLALYCFPHIQSVERGMTVYSVMGAWSYLGQDKQKVPTLFYVNNFLESGYL